MLFIFFAINHAFKHKLITVQYIFNFFRENIFTVVRNNHTLLSTANKKKSVFIKISQVTGFKPFISQKYLT